MPNTQTSVPAFTAGQVLTAAQMTEVNTGIPVFATTTTRDAAFGGTGEKTLAEGQLCYLESTKVVQIYSGTAWITLAPGMSLISTTTLTGASIVLSSIPATFVNLRLIVRNFVPATDNASLRLRVNADTGTNYRDAAVGVAQATTFNDTSYRVTYGSDNSVSTYDICVLDFPDYANTVTAKQINSYSMNTNSTTTTQFDYRVETGLFNSTAAISSLTLFCDTGNLTSGTALLYGY